MVAIKKIIIPIFACVLLIYYLLAGYPKWLLPSEPITVYSIAIVLVTYIGLVALGISLSTFIMRDSMIKMKNHIVVKAIREKNRVDLWIIFPVTMVFEELLFRLVLLEILYAYFGLLTTVLIGTIIFSLYHLHTLAFKDINITLAFVILAIILGVVLNLLFYYFGLIFCIFIHWISVFLIFLYIENKIKRIELEEQEKNEILNLKDTPINYASNYVTFSGILAGLSFTLVFFYLGMKNLLWIDYALVLAFTFSSVCFLIGAAGYADASKIKKNHIKLIQPGKTEKLVIVSFYDLAHLSDVYVLCGFFCMIFALGIALFRFDIILGFIGLGLILYFLVYFFKCSPSHNWKK